MVVLQFGCQWEYGKILHVKFSFAMIFYIIGSVLPLFYSSTINTELPMKFDHTATGILKAVAVMNGQTFYTVSIILATTIL